MRISGRAAFVGTLVLLATGAAVGAYAGAALAAALTAPDVREVVVEDPALSSATPAWALRSRGGFTGFGDLPALPGDVLSSGAVVELAEGRLVVEGADARSAIEYEAPARLYRIRPSAGALAEGETVLVRLVADAVTGVLRVVPRER